MSGWPSPGRSHSSPRRSCWPRVVGQVTGNVPFGGGYDTLSPGVGVRFVQGSFGAELGAVLPLGGPLRPFSAVARVSWRL